MLRNLELPIGSSQLSFCPQPEGQGREVCRGSCTKPWGHLVSGCPATSTQGLLWGSAGRGHTETGLQLQTCTPLQTMAQCPIPVMGAAGWLCLSPRGHVELFLQYH